MWYLFKRALQMVIILAVLSAALFGLLSSMPGNPIDLLITSNPNVKPEDVIRLKRLRGLDKPWYVQYMRWIFGYPEPARPPIIRDIDDIALEPADSAMVKIDLSDYLIDPNYFPSSALLETWLNDLWPNWKESAHQRDIQKALAESHLPSFLLSVAKKSIDLQNRLVAKINHESARSLTVEGLFGAKAQGLILSAVKNDLKNNTGYLWFLVRNGYGQEKVGRIPLVGQEHSDLMMKIDGQIIGDESKTFTLDLTRFLADQKPASDTRFFLSTTSLGAVSEGGQYVHRFTNSGQTVILASVKTPDGRSENFAFEVEHGVVGNKDRFNQGFLYFFLGDRYALGFSQTYKRPVYDLLFGTPPICGDGRVDIGETCDDGNNQDGDGCTADCFGASENYLSRADATISGYIVRSGRIGNTIQLMFPALVLSLLIAIPLGVYSAYRQYSALDYLINFLAFIGISLPVFWFGIMMIYLFAESFQFFPAGGVQTPGIYGEGTLNILLDRLKHAILPTIVLSIFYVGRWLRYMRSSMLEILPMDYIRTARAKGLRERVVILKHAFRNALIPVVTVLALSIPSLFGGALLTETVFSWPGVGRLQYEAVMNSDYYVAIVVFLVAAVLVMVGNLLADVLYVLVDPRIRKK